MRKQPANWHSKTPQQKRREQIIGTVLILGPILSVTAGVLLFENEILEILFVILFFFTSSAAADRLDKKIK